MHDSAARSEALLESLLTLARSESAVQDRAPVDLAELARTVVAERVDTADRAGLRVEVALEPVLVHGDRWLLERLIANLVDNGIAYNEPDGWLRIRVHDDGTGPRRRDRARTPAAAAADVGGAAPDEGVVVEVTNTGPFLSDDQVADLLKPFHRANNARPGYGLGLTVIQSVTHAHGGRIEVIARRGGGLRVLILLPGVRELSDAATSAGRSSTPLLAGGHRGPGADREPGRAGSPLWDTIGR